MEPLDTPRFRIENIAPILRVQDISRSVAFYTGVLEFTNADWGTDQFTLIHRDNTGIYLCKGGQGSPGTWIWIGFDGDIFALHEKLQANGVRIKLPPTNFSWAYEMQVEDPDGHILRFGTDPSDKKPFADQEVNF
ncbi:VOC family protein [Dawidia soli]|uniref:VOC family protein n=1 Tax=Dawidia soli TaxID=2782352 RepID=A0AAP2D4E2_9BACT|nr:VOC family protein [Dawidia soli]MBT1685123.1 VOC family protein [Dawidia soli]